MFQKLHGLPRSRCVENGRSAYFASKIPVRAPQSDIRPTIFPPAQAAGVHWRRHRQIPRGIAEHPSTCCFISETNSNLKSNVLIGVVFAAGPK
jgi:hypothetical protein